VPKKVISRQIFVKANRLRPLSKPNWGH